MNTSTDIGHLGAHLFSIHYAGRELACYVRRRGEILDVDIDEIFDARLKIEIDGSLRQLSGDKLPDSLITFIKKQVLEDDTFK
jgi:hypothetical protein